MENIKEEKILQSASLTQHRKGKIIAIDSTLDEVTVRMDIDQCSGYRIGEVVAITSPVA